MIRQTSLDAHRDIQDEGIAESQRLNILHFLRDYPNGLTRNEIVRMTGITINAVCGRCNELLKYGSVYEDGLRTDPVSRKGNYILKSSQ